MRGALPLYLQFARCAFQRQAAYRLANWTGIAVNFFFFLIHAQVYLAFFGTREELRGWTARDAVLYFAISEALLMVLGGILREAYDLGERVRTGDVAIDLVRPVRLYLRAIAERFGTAAYYLLTRSVVLYAGAVLLYRLAQPLEARLLWLPLSLGLGVAISGAVLHVAHSTSFWIEQSRGPLAASTLLLWFFGGVAVPLDFYPEGLRLVCDALPFRGAVYTPIALATGRLQGAALLFGLVHQIVWLALLLGLGHLLETRGVRRLVVHGG